MIWIFANGMGSRVVVSITTPRTTVPCDWLSMGRTSCRQNASIFSIARGDLKPMCLKSDIGTKMFGPHLFSSAGTVESVLYFAINQ